MDARSAFLALTVVTLLASPVAGLWSGDSGSNKGLVVWLASDGQTGIGAPDTFGNVKECTRFSPFENSCTVKSDRGLGINWYTGFKLPPPDWTDSVPIGGYFGSTRVTITGSLSPGKSIVWECNWAVASAAGISPPTVSCRGISGEPVGGIITVAFHAGAYDAYGVGPSTNDVEAGVGKWTGFLTYP